jgi:hypothetical protein
MPLLRNPKSRRLALAHAGAKPATFLGKKKRRNIAPVAMAALQSPELVGGAVDVVKEQQKFMFKIGLGIAAVGGLWVIKKMVTNPKTEALFSVPTILGGVGGYAGAAALNLKTELKVVSAALGLGIGWAVQYYVLREVDENIEKKIEAAEDTGSTWYKPWTW